MKVIKTIERPIGNHTSTEYSFVARFITTTQQWENIMEYNQNKQFVIMGKAPSFQPHVVVMIPNEKDSFHNQYYQIPLEIVGETKDHEFSKKIIERLEVLR